MSVRRRASLTCLGLAAAALCSAGMAAMTAPLTIPSAAVSSEGNSDNLYPFNGDPMRYQQVVAASEFPSGGRWITALAFRPDAAGGGAFSTTLENVQINLSTTPRAPGTLSKTFASNVGGDEAVVYTGQLNLSSAFTGPDSGPKDCDILVTLQTPFYYDPSAGNLLLDIRNFSSGMTTLMDAHDAPDSTARIWSSDVNSATAVSTDPFPSVGLVIRFTFN